MGKRIYHPLAFLLLIMLFCKFTGTNLCFADSNIEEKKSENVVIEDSETPKIIPETSQDINEIEESADDLSTDDEINSTFELDLPTLQIEKPYDLFLAYMDAIAENNYANMIAATLDATPNSESYETWQTFHTYDAGYEIYSNNDHALYLVILSFTDSGELNYPIISGEYIPSITRYLYVTKKDGYWYADGPLHRDFPPADWWNGNTYNWEIYNHGFDDKQDGEENLNITQADMDAVNSECRAYTQKLFQCDPS